jgi:hypothetical protein
MPFFAASEAPPRPESMKFPVYSQLAGNLAFSETSSQLTPPSSGESDANLTNTRRKRRPTGRAIYTVVFGQALSFRLAVQNRSTHPIIFEEALHIYFAISDIADIAISGLAGTHLYR